MSNAVSNRAGFQAAVDSAVMELVQREHFHDHSVVTLPVWLPSGSSVLVEVWWRRSTFMVTDGACTYQEAVLMGEERVYGKAAAKVALEAGVEFRDKAFILDQVAADQIAGAIGTIADCAKQAMERTVVKLEERRHGDGTKPLVDKLVQVFTARHVEQGGSFVGASSHSWPVAAIVRADSRPTLFEPVSAQHNAIASVVMKFHDIARLDDPPTRISVVRDKKDLGDMLAVLQQASHVINEDATPEILKSLVGAR